MHVMCVAPVYFYTTENYPMRHTCHVRRDTQPMRRALQLKHIFGLQRDFFTPPWFVLVALMYLGMKLDYWNTKISLMTGILIFDLSTPTFAIFETFDTSV